MSVAGEHSPIPAAKEGRIRSEVLWVAFGRYGTRGSGLLTTLVLALLLTPDQFGLMAGAMIAIDVLMLLCDFGLNKELVTRHEQLEDATHTAFWMTGALGVVLFAVAAILAQWLPQLLGFNGVTGIMVLASTTLVFSSTAGVPGALLQRQRRFKTLAIPPLAASVLAGIASIAAAFNGAGAYSLAVREVVASVTEAILLFTLSGYRPRWCFSKKLGHEIFGFAKHLFGANVVACIADQVCPTALARLFGSSVLGGYGLANRMATLPVREASAILGRVLFPHFSMRKKNPQDARALLIQSAKVIALIGLPTAVGVAVFSQPLLRLAFGSKWDHAVPFFQTLPFYALLVALSGPLGEACKACGKTSAVSAYYSILLVVLLLALFPMLSLFGAVGPVLAAMLAAAVALVWLARRTSRLLGMPDSNYWASLTGVAAAALAALLPVLALQASNLLSGPTVKLAAEALTGSVCFIAILWVTERPLLASLRAR